MLKCEVIIVRNCGGSATRGLEQGPALRVLDAPCPRGREANLRE